MVSLHYSTSSISQYRFCPFSYFLSRELRLEPREPDPSAGHHMAFGSAVHVALDLLYKGESLQVALNAFCKAYPTQLDRGDKAKTQDTGVQMLEAYVKQYSGTVTNWPPPLGRAMKWGLDPYWKVLSSELPDDIDAYTDRAFKVVLDLVVEDTRTGCIYGVDHKVTGKALSSFKPWDFWNRFDPNSQITRYTDHIKRKYGRCDGFYINAIGMYHRSRAYKGEPAGPWHKFERQMFNRTPAQLRDEEVDTMRWIEDLEAARLAHSAGVEGAWRRNQDNCCFCEYREQICKNGYDWPRDQALIQLQYRRKGDEV